MLSSALLAEERPRPTLMVAGAREHVELPTAIERVIAPRKTYARPLQVTADLSLRIPVGFTRTDSGSGIANEPPALSAARVRVERPVDPRRRGLGFVADVQVASEFPKSGSGAPYLRLNEAFVTVADLSRSGVEVQVGRFASNLGFEGHDSWANWNDSVSLLHRYVLPMNQSGLRARYVIAPALAVSGFVDAPSKGVGPAGPKGGMGSSLTLDLPHGINVTHTFVPSTFPGRSGRLDDTVVSFSRRNRVRAAVHMAHGTTRSQSEQASWKGAGAYLRVAPSRSWAIQQRLEWFDDRESRTTGTAQLLRSATLTVEHRWGDALALRLEGRHTASSAAALPDAPSSTASPNARPGTVITAGLLFRLRTH